jgi:hypothetical protein
VLRWSERSVGQRGAATRLVPQSPARFDPTPCLLFDACQPRVLPFEVASFNSKLLNVSVADVWLAVNGLWKKNHCHACSSWPFLLTRWFASMKNSHNSDLFWRGVDSERMICLSGSADWNMYPKSIYQICCIASTESTSTIPGGSETCWSAWLTNRHSSLFKNKGIFISGSLLLTFLVAHIFLVDVGLSLNLASSTWSISLVDCCVHWFISWVVKHFWKLRT